jgi:acyl-CoA-binding protein
MGQNDQELRKKVDETWKETVSKEKQKLNQEPPAQAQQREVNFISFVTSLGLQALFALGATGEADSKDSPKVDLQQARYLIEAIAMLKEKTSGNLTTEETNLIEELLYSLRMQYIQKSAANGAGNE